MIENFKEYVEKRYNTKKKCILIVGPPGSGKGTQSSIISIKTGYDHISTGDMLRKSKDPKIKKILKSGDLVSDNMVYKELEKYIKKNINNPGFILDGYPRNVKQKYYLEQILESNNLVISHIFFLNVSEDEIKKRIEKRSKDSGRSDDNKKSLAKRLKEYNDQTFPMIESFKNNPRFIEIAADGDSSDVTKIIFENIPEI